MRAIQARIETPAPLSNFSDLDNFSLETHTEDSQHSPPPEVPSRKRPLPRSPELRHLTAEAHKIAKSKKLRPESQADLVRFTQMHGPERELLMASVRLETRDRVTEIAQSGNWVLPSQLETNCVRYTSACVLSPTIPSYGKLTISTVVMKLLHNLDVETPGSSQLPSGLHAAQGELVVSKIGSIATKKRSDLKIKIEKSLKTKDCIELLCESIASPLNITVTTLLYARVAFLCIKYPQMRDSKKFWGHIDKQLKVLRDRFATKKAMAAAMEFFLSEDRKAFTNGKSDTAQYHFSDPLSVPEWQQAADRELDAIMPAELSAAQASQDAAAHSDREDDTA
ncbi:hypothetical protein AURDEDRAFT_172918 [Auricularia subglabra TFB-10046 SS5]|nr:hypothetical protein AURDEDRAFT_172918 [Auricularia subglabra TFB-10046 SS5]